MSLEITSKPNKKSKKKKIILRGGYKKLSKFTIESLDDIDRLKTETIKELII